MNKTKKVGITTIAAFALAACTFATLGMAKGMSASAAEVKPEPAAQGWYIVGNGAGSLKDCSWTNYELDFKLAGEGREGDFVSNEISLYEGDAFKILYADGTWVWPSDSGWTADVMAQYSNLASTADGYFVDGGLGNIQATKEGQGKYVFYLAVTSDSITLMYERTGEVAPIAQEEMYVVGSLANYPTCNWPGSIDVATSCPKLTLNAETQKWTATLELKAGDQFKVYNLMNNAYFPSGMNNDCIIAEDGTYEIEYGVKAPSFIVTNVATGEIVYR